MHGRNLQEEWGLPGWFPFSAGFLILAFPGLFRFTCYYYRKAYYRAFWADPPACAVGEPRKSYWGENRLPLISAEPAPLRHVLRPVLPGDAGLGRPACLLVAYRPRPSRTRSWKAAGFGIGVGTLIMVLNVLLLTGFTLGCNSVRHLVGGRLDCFSCPKNPENVRAGYKLWRFSTILNEHHMEWAWASLFSVGFTDVYIRMCSLGIWHDFRFF